MILIREYKPEDRSFIISTWLKGNYSQMAAYRVAANYFVKPVSEAYFKHHGAIIERILNDPTTTIFVACNEEDQGQIFGYAIMGDDCFHWVYTKQVYRRNGIAKKLLEACDFSECSIASHMSNDFGFLSKYFKQKVNFNPYIIQKDDL
jgi:GNAT superfamily N-acetyltransferase